MKIPFLNNRKKKLVPIEPTADEARIQRELAYQKRLGATNPRLTRLQKRISAQRRRSYGSREEE